MTPQASGVEALLQAVSPVSEQVVWVSGHQGTFARTLDGGATWQAATVPGADTLQFRDVHAFDADRAVLLSAGTGELSGIFWSEDAGATWTRAFTMDHPQGFLDCLDFVDERRGLAYGDAVDGDLYVLETADGGRTWSRVPPGRLPEAGSGEGGFAASGTCVRADPSGRVWIGTGAGGAGRVLRSDDAGATWTFAETGVVRGTAAGLTTLSFATPRVGLALGGDLEVTDLHTDNVWVTRDGGTTWTAGGRMALRGPVYGSSYVPGTDSVFVAVGPGGADYTLDLGRTWMSLDTLTYWATGFASDRAGWMVGPGGRITRVGF